MIIKGNQLRKDILRDGMKVDEIRVIDSDIKFNDYGYAITNGSMHRFWSNTKNEIEGKNVKGIIDKNGNEIFPFKSYNDEDDEIPGLSLIGNNIISKEGTDENNNPIYNHAQIKNGFVDLSYENKILYSPLTCNHFKLINNHTILGSNLLNLNKGGKVPIYYKKYFLYSLLYGGSIVSEYFNEIKTLRYDNHSSILKAHAMFYALEPTEDDWILFYNDGSFVNGEYKVTCTIDDRGNSLPPYSTRVGDRYISFEPTEDEKEKYIGLKEIKARILKEIVNYEFDSDKITIDNLLRIKLKKSSLAALKSILEMLSQSKGLEIGEAIKYANKEMVEEEISRRILSMKKNHPNIK